MNELAICLASAPLGKTGIILHHADGTLQAYSAAATKILGIPIEQLQNGQWIDPAWQTIHADGSPFPSSTHPTQTTLQTTQPCTNVVMGVYQPTGNLIWLQISTEVLWSQGENYSVLTTLVDITPQADANSRFQIAPQTTPQTTPQTAPQIAPQTAFPAAFPLQDLPDADPLPASSDMTAAALFFERSPDPLAVIGLDGYFKQVNPRFSELLGYSQAELQTMPFTALIHPDDRAATVATLEQLPAGTSTLDFENRYRLQDGTYRWLSWTASPVFEQRIIYCIARDITQSKQMSTALQQANQDLAQRVARRTAQLEQSNTALRESEERHQLAMAIARMFTFEWEPVTDAVKRSPQCGDILGLPAAEAEQDTGANYFQRLHPDDRDRFIALFPTLTPDHSTYKTTYRLIRPDGQTVILEESARALFDAQGQFTRLIGITADVTEQQRLMAELEENRAVLQRQLAEIETIYESAPIGLNVLDTDLRFVRINQRLAEINGFSIEAHIGRTVRELLPDIADMAEQLLRPILETGEPLLNVEIRGETPAQPGVQRVWRESFLPLKDGDRVIGINTVCQEVTEQIQIEAALRQSEARFRNMADNAPVMIWVTDTTGYCTYLSQSWYEFTGQTEATGLGFGWLDAVHPEDYADAREIFLDANLRQAAFRLEYRLRRHDGEYRWAIDAASPWFSDAGQYQGYIGSVIDISDRKQAEEALRESEERYRTLFTTMDDGFCVIEMLFNDEQQPIDYRFLEINPAFEQQTGLQQAEGKTARQLLPTLEEHWFEIYGNIALTGQPARFENGSEVMNRWFEVYAFRVGQPQEHKVAILFKDISDRRAIETQREKLLQQEQAAREAAERANRMKDEFLAVLSHELRTPLNPILGWATLLQSPQISASKLQQGLSTIERNARQQVQMIDDLLDISRIIRGKINLHFAPVFLSEPIMAALETVRLAAEAKAIQMEVWLDPSVGAVRGDAGRLQQVIWNLLSNAIKFTPAQGRVTLQLAEVNGQAQVQVIDTGKGIQPEFLPYVFELFRQQDSSITRAFGGLGLGLAIARQVVEAHGGTITAASAGENQGATFTVQFPLIEISRPNIPDTCPLPNFNLSHLRIIAIDDELDSLELIKILLEQEGATVQAFASAPPALRALEQEPFDLLISDIGMPDMDGYQFIRQVRALASVDNRSLPAIALTAYAGETNRHQILAAGFQAHLAKPIDPQALLDTIVALAGR